MIPFLGTRPLVFVHLPKTAGTSVAELLGCRFSPSATLALRGVPDDSADELLARKDSYRFIHGHLPYDVRSSFETEPFMFTILRHPIERAVSAYSYLRQHATRGEATPWVSSARHGALSLASRLPMAEFARSPVAARHTGNRQVQMLSEPFHPHYFARRTDESAPLGADDLARACENLAACDSFGLTEQLTATMDLLSYELHTEPLGTPGHANATRVRPATEELDVATLEVLEECGQLDLALYRFGCDLFESRRRALVSDQIAARARRYGTEPPPTECRFDGPIPGHGWYAAERSGDSWQSWTGPGTTSSLTLAAPAGDGECELDVDVVHAVSPEQLAGTSLLVNGNQLAVDVVAGPAGLRLTAAVPRSLLQPGGAANHIEIVVSRVLRPCDVSPTNLDSRSLGLALRRVALVAL